MSEPREITDYLRQTTELGGSDLHLTVDAPPATRVDGTLRGLEDFPLTAAQVRSHSRHHE